MRLPVTTLLSLSLIHSAASFVSAEEKTERPRQPLQVGVLLFDGVELLDFAGPAEVFIVAEYGNGFDVHTIASSKKPIRTMGGVTVTPSHSYKDAPKLDIVVIPGGGMGNVGNDGIQWIRKSSGEARVVMSVCMGAFLLGRAGQLDDVKATTHAWGIESLKRAAPRCQVVSSRRFVDSGKIVTTAGVTAGIDGALHLVERFYGKEAARWTAEEWMEYRTGSPTGQSGSRGTSDSENGDAATQKSDRGNKNQEN